METSIKGSPVNNTVLDMTTLPLCNLIHLSSNLSINETLHEMSTLQNLNETSRQVSVYLQVLPYVVTVLYILICILGLLGNGLVIYVVLVFAKMKTVTNMYILNLALSDILFLTMLPILAVTGIIKHWVFGFAMCKIYFVIYSINLFGGAFTLCVMSADRFIAVCHPIRALRYRTPRIALFLCLCIWSLSFLVMMPTILYSQTIEHRNLKGKYTCIIHWPENQAMSPDKAFIWYSFILGFAIPVSLISVFYFLVILRLRQIGAAKKSKEKRKSHRRVTRLVLTVIAIYVVCWLPYWTFQVFIVFKDVKDSGESMILLLNGFTVLSYANSMLNPLLYAFLSDNFRKSFVKAFKCVSSLEAKTSVCNENSVFPKSSQAYTRSGTTVEERMELSCMEACSGSSPHQEQTTVRLLQDEQGFLKPPVQL
ncbi:somatostatin receptor type 2 [Biomphalaria pfeifferi]|uniref:Somatostatin receptor type 2 n=1 Tax=Biomphalaria pfeifferi TaxID=112525 RepID=A0AAD8BBT9_BIOPF|nr:somatostatin receptor type 2 [Biomphalaria pfeifferi]